MSADEVSGNAIHPATMAATEALPFSKKERRELIASVSQQSKSDFICIADLGRGCLVDRSIDMGD